MEVLKDQEHGPTQPLPDHIVIIECITHTEGDFPVGTMHLFDTSSGEGIPGGWVLMDGVANVGGSGIAMPR